MRWHPLEVRRDVIAAWRELEGRLGLASDLLTARQVLLVGACLGLLAGYAEFSVVLFGARRGHLDPATYQQYLSLAALVALPVLPGGFRSVRFVLFTLTTLAVFGFLSVVARALHSVPTLILAAGLGSVATRLASGRRDGLLRLSKGVALTLGLLLAAHRGGDR